MPHWLLVAIDIGFLVLHTGLIVLNVFGWMWRRTRRLALITLLVTGFSWLAIGLWYGQIGYCVCTDWHWSVRDQLGYPRETSSYVQFLVLELTGQRAPESWVVYGAGGIYLFSLIMSIALNRRDRRRSHVVAGSVPAPRDELS